MQSWVLCLVCLLLLMGTKASEVSCAITQSSAIIDVQSAIVKTAIGVPGVAVPTSRGPGAEGITEKNMSELQESFYSWVDLENPNVVKNSSLIIANYTGFYTIEQVNAIYSYMENGDGHSIQGWSNQSEERGKNNYQYASQTLELGRETKHSGVGDCGDFAILISALVEAKGGTTRIILARNNTTGSHVFAEVYLGQFDTPSSKVNDIIKWLIGETGSDKIFVHINNSTKDVWLNLDWSGGHPGGPFSLGDTYYVFYIKKPGKESTPTVTRLIDVPKDLTAELTARGSALDNQGDYPGALQAYENALKLNQNYAPAWVGKGKALADIALSNHQNNYYDAINAYDRAIEIDPVYALAWCDKAAALYLQGNYNESIRAFDIATTLDPTFAIAWWGKGNAFSYQGNYGEAINAYSRSVELNPYAGYAWYDLSNALSKIGRIEEANAVFAKAKELGYTG